MGNIYSTKERRAQILQQLRTDSKVFVSKLSEQFLISEVSIRKDLEEMEQRNLLIRVRGGAIRLPEVSVDNDAPIRDKQLFHYREKQSIGKMAASLIQENETIILDSGTTTLEIAKNLHALKNLTIVTNAINIAIELSKYKRFSIILLGGHLRGTSLSTVGPLAETSLKIFYSDKLFLGVDSFSFEKGVSTPNIEEANINQSMITKAKEVIAVCDSSKFGKRSFAFIAPVSKIDTIVTDDGITPDIKRQITKTGIKLYVTKAESLV